MDAEQYIDELVQSERNQMVERAEWISEHRPQFSDGFRIPGGEKALVIYEDSQLCYIHGILTGTIVLGQSFIEQSICAFAYITGEFSESDRPGYHEARKFLEENDILAPEDVEGVPLNELHNLRNSIIHFRTNTGESNWTGRIMYHNCEYPESITPATHEMLKRDAKKVLRTCFSVIRMFGIGDI
ncbi:hypothetical protein U4E84_13520 [Halorubrum sp. AD140]|uniref:hypothetical protein n=1 Tax=Halorubrum sp. AD140 TaxID=3050073 RepID=UPI002ACC7124|nr:hypothetical protein [Halorubrum sp. AD140]MDZ5812363.1 hypothetical protein [Halorubrum sp. AD140]